jgi:5-methylcytosine-specific restriction endonuclease McrA
VISVKRSSPHASHDTVARALSDAIRAEVASQKKASFDRREMWTLDYEPRASGWDAGWGERAKGLYKRALVGAPYLDVQAKCVWCEQLRAWKGELHVDHLRPKARVTTWRGSPPEVADTPPEEEPHGDGYWWLAHTWNNWNLACYGCNSEWKRSLLPRVGPHLPHGEGVEASEVLLLLDPSSAFQTRDHFHRNQAGYMFGRSEVGRATIITCGLNRKLLVSARLKKVPDVLAAIRDFKAALASGDEGSFERDAARLAGLGDARAEFAGMVRHLTEERIGDTWESLFG